MRLLEKSDFGSSSDPPNGFLTSPSVMDYLFFKQCLPYPKTPCCSASYYYIAGGGGGEDGGEVVGKVPCLCE